jgi:stress-induced morphogen
MKYSKSIKMTIEQMKSKLEIAFPESEINVFDMTGTQDHWEVFVKSEQFKGLTKIQQHQSVMNVFSPELKTGEVHALSIKTHLK